MKREAVGIAGIASITALLLPSPYAREAPSALAYADCSNLDRYAHQLASRGYKGMFGWQYTFVPGVPNYQVDTSASHMYTFDPDSSLQFIETGWYKGTPHNLPQAHPYPKYYAAKWDSTMTDWWPSAFGDATRDAYIAYEMQYEGYDSASGTWKWGVYIDNFASPKITYYHRDLAVGVPLSGGEITGGAASGTQMRADIQPVHQIKNSDMNWYNWTPAFMTSQNDFVTTCDDPGFTFTYDAQYQDFRVTGQKP